MSSTLFAADSKRLCIRRVVVRSANAEAAANAFVMTQGDTASVLISCARTQYRQAITASVSGLPTGVTATFRKNGATSNILYKNEQDLTLVLDVANDATLVTDDTFTLTLTSGMGAQDIPMAITVQAGAATVTPPTITTFTPRSGSISTTQAVTITGTNFLAGATVTVGGTAATSVTVVSATSITCTFPALAQGYYDVVVTTTDGTAVAPQQYSSGITPFFEETFVGGVLNARNGVNYSPGSEGLGGRGNLPTRMNNAPRAHSIKPAGFAGNADYDPSHVEPGYTHSFQAAYQPVATTLANDAPQIEINLGRDLPEVWFEGRVWIPENYFHRARTNTVLMNNKFLVFYTTYDFNTAQFDIETVRDGIGRSQIKVVARRRSSAGGNPKISEVVNGQRFDFIGQGFPMEPGTWNTIRLYLKVETPWGSGLNGQYKMWINGTVLFDYPNRGYGAYAEDQLTAANRVVKGVVEPWESPLQRNRLRYCYLNGYANSGFTDRTTFNWQYWKFFDVNPGW